MGVDLAKALGVMRTGVGALSWVSPAASWRTFGLGPLAGDARGGLVTRLFGSRDLVLGQMVLCPDPEVRRAGLQAGVAVDSIDLVASLLALRKGAPKVTILTATGGAAAFMALGLFALAQEPHATVS